MRFIIIFLLFMALAIPVSASGAPEITSWKNDMTNDDSLTLMVNTGEAISFNIKSNQPVALWKWTLNGNDQISPLDSLAYVFIDEGSYRIAVNGSNSNGTTQTIVWNITVKEEKGTETRISILSWYPQAVEYVYVNDTVNRTAEYSITTAEPLITNTWTVDGIPVAGIVNGNTSHYRHRWDNKNIGFHMVIYKGSDANSDVEFRWYINVYEIGENKGGSIFDVIEDALENHVTDIRIRMFKYKISKDGNSVEYANEKVNQLHDEITRRKMQREALNKDFRSGNISIEEYVSSLKQSQWDTKYDIILAKGMAKVAKEDLKNNNVSREFDNISIMLEDMDKGKARK